MWCTSIMCGIWEQYWRIQAEERCRASFPPSAAGGQGTCPQMCCLILRGHWRSRECGCLWTGWGVPIHPSLPARTVVLLTERNVQYKSWGFYLFSRQNWRLKPGTRPLRFLQMLLLRGKEGARIHGGFATKTWEAEHQKITGKGSQIPQGNEFSIFLCMESYYVWV